MISLGKYLYGPGKKRDEPGVPDSVAALFQFSSSLLVDIQEDVLVGDNYASLRTQLLDLKASLRNDWTPAEESAAESTAKRVVCEYRASVNESTARQAIEIQSIFSTLNQALIVMSEGNDSSVSRLTTIQTALGKACLLDDIVALKSSLSKTLDFIRQEAVVAHEAGTKDIAEFSTQLGKARDFIGNARIKMLGRSEGVTLITENLAKEGEPIFVVGYLCDKLQSVALRYGAPIAEELVFHLINERIRPITPEGALFRWTSSSIVATFPSSGDLAKLRSQVTELNRTPLVHRILLGGRTAVLTMSPSQFIAQGKPGEADRIVEQVDRFAQIGPGSGT